MSASLARRTSSSTAAKCFFVSSALRNLVTSSPMARACSSSAAGSRAFWLGTGGRASAQNFPCSCAASAASAASAACSWNGSARFLYTSARPWGSRRQLGQHRLGARREGALKIDEGHEGDRRLRVALGRGVAHLHRAPEGLLGGVRRRPAPGAAAAPPEQPPPAGRLAPWAAAAGPPPAGRRTGGSPDGGRPGRLLPGAPPRERGPTAAADVRAARSPATTPPPPPPTDRHRQLDRAGDRNGCPQPAPPPRPAAPAPHTRRAGRCHSGRRARPADRPGRA